MELTIILMEDENAIACDELLATMVDDLTGAFRSLLNAGDNEGRLAWEVAGKNTRMLDDCRLLVYPDFDAGGDLPVLTVTIDSQYPYAQDLTQTRTACADGVTVPIANTGSADYYPVFLVNVLNNVVDSGVVHSFLIENLTTGQQIYYDDTLPGAVPISAGGHYAEIRTFENTIYLDGDGANLKAGIDQMQSEYFPLLVGTNNIRITGCDMDVLWAPAYG